MSDTDAPTTSAEPPVGDGLDATRRRCWRCLQMFPEDASDSIAERSGWWVCEPCHAALFAGRPSRR